MHICFSFFKLFWASIHIYISFDSIHQNRSPSRCSNSFTLNTLACLTCMFNTVTAGALSRLGIDLPTISLMVRVTRIVFVTWDNVRDIPWVSDKMSCQIHPWLVYYVFKWDLSRVYINQSKCVKPIQYSTCWCLCRLLTIKTHGDIMIFKHFLHNSFCQRNPPFIRLVLSGPFY